MKCCQDWWLKDVEASKQTHKCYKELWIFGKIYHTI